MATISSTLRLIEQTTAPIQKTISAMNRMVDTMEMLNRSADMPNMDSTFGELRAEISLADHALDQFNAELQDTGQQAASVARVSSGFGGLSRAIIAANQGLQLMQQLWGGISRLGGLSDERVGVDARLGLINDGLRTQAELEAAVMAAANDTRSEYEATAALVARMGRQDYFKGSNDAAIEFAKTLNEGLIVSGASTSEAASALTQLSQGIASGVLRGEEFNSVMENGSVIAEMMAQSLGITKGEMRALAEDGALTSDIVVSAIMQQADAIEEQFNSMPVTYGQAMATMHNQTSLLMDTISQPGQAIDVIITRIAELNTWLGTAEGQVFFTNMAQGIDLAVTGVSTLAVAAAETYQFFVNNWSAIEPILWGLGIAVGGLTTAYLIYKGVAIGIQAVELISAAITAAKTGATLLATSATAAETAAQWGLNAAFLACPITWIVGGIILAVAAVVGIGIAIRNATRECEWFNEIAAAVVGGVMAHFAAMFASIYNGVAYNWNMLATFAEFFVNVFIDPVYAVKKLFYDLESTTLGYVADICSSMQALVNLIPGVELNMTGGLENLLAKIEQAKSELTSDKAVISIKRMEYQDTAALAGQEYGKGADWVHGLYQGKSPADAALAQIAESPAVKGDFPALELAGGKIDKVGGEIDISNQSLEYLSDIAEIRALGAFDAYSTIAYEQADELLLNQRDAELLRSSANSDVNIYYLNYSGGVKVKNDIRQGTNLDEIKQTLYDESEAEIETGISFIEEVAVG